MFFVHLIVIIAPQWKKDISQRRKCLATLKHLREETKTLALRSMQKNISKPAAHTALCKTLSRFN